MQGTIKIECSETEEVASVAVSCHLEASRVDVYKILNTLMTEAFHMDDDEFQMFLLWRRLEERVGKSERVKVDLGAMRMREEEK